MILEDVYNTENFNDLIKMEVKIEASLEFYSYLIFSKHSIEKDEKMKNYRILERTLNYYYSKYKVKLVDKIKNKKFLVELLEEINKKEKTYKELILDEIPEF